MPRDYEDYKNGEKGNAIRAKLKKFEMIEENTTDVVLLTGGSGRISVEVFDPLGQCKVQLPQLDKRRQGHTSHYDGSNLLLCGGDIVRGIFSCSHWVNGTFQHHSQLREDRDEYAGVTLGGTVYLVGGYGYPSQKRSMETWSEGNSWTSGPSMQQGMSYACGVATSDTTFIIIGGYGDDDGYLSSVEEFNTVTGRWRSLAAMLGGGREGHSCVNIGGGQVLVAGGYLNSALLYRVDTDQWRTAASLNGWRRNGELVVVNGRILYMGGKQKNFWLLF